MPCAEQITSGGRARWRQAQACHAVTIKGAIDGWRFIGCTIGRGKADRHRAWAVRQLLDTGAQAYAQRDDQGVRVGGRLTHPRHLLER
jgi:hypothetical protein